MPKFTLGGERLGSGAGMEVETREFNRSTHDKSYRLKTTAGVGTLIPFLTELALPGSTHDISLNCDILTGPTVGPLFGSFKVQLDVFTIPIRLYQAQLHNDALGIGKNMGAVKLPVMRFPLPNPKASDGTNLDNFQFNPSHVASYFDLRGGMVATGGNVEIVTREVNGLPYLMYPDIYKNYYGNKAEGIGAYIHSETINENITIEELRLDTVAGDVINESLTLVQGYVGDGDDTLIQLQDSTTLYVNLTNFQEEFDPSRIGIHMGSDIFNGNTQIEDRSYAITEIFQNIYYTHDYSNGIHRIVGSQPYDKFKYITVAVDYYTFNKNDDGSLQPQVKTFKLDVIDKRREDILSKIKETSPYMINDPTDEINLGGNWWTDIVEHKLSPDGSISNTATRAGQEGLFLKTYQSDKLQNWLSTEGIEQIDRITAVQVRENEDGQDVIILNELNLNQKIFNMLNAVESAGGSYRDYIKVSYNTNMPRMTMSPVYVGGLSKELVFQQIISNAQAGEQPLGTLAGRGILTDKHKGGKITIKTEEPSYIMGLFSLTPRIDYSQGNDWKNDLQTMADLHNPYMDKIGFQNLPMEWMAWWTSQTSGTLPTANPNKKIVGKQPAWIHYQTNENRVRGHFADEQNQMFMVLTRRYEPRWTVGDNTQSITIKDMTTYIDPAKYNYIFADIDRNAQNFWVQIDVKMQARMVMSAQLMPIM